jgi:tetratricopeptide (TPR) repeat protein
MLPAEQTFTAYLYRPYLDLGPVVDGGPLAPWGVEFAARGLDEGRAYPWTYAEYPPSLRERLLELTGLPEYRVRDPRDLAPALRTPRWQRLCDALERCDALPAEAQNRVLRLLGKLGLYHAALDRLPALSAEEIGRDGLTAERAYLRVLARFLIGEDGAAPAGPEGPFALAEFELVATHAPHGSPARIRALNHLTVQHAKRGRDLAAVAHWLARHREEIELARPTLDDATYALLLSRHHRAAGFLPQLRGDRAGMVAEMDRCQDYAERLPRATPEQRIAADELLYAALESRTKEALWLGELALAAARARRLAALWPLEPAVHAHLGQVLVEQGRIAEALEAYLAAARLGAPQAEAAWFLAGQCHEALDAPARACDAYLAALRLDPLGVSALERLADVAAGTANGVLAGWSRARLAALQADEAAHEPRRGLAPYQEYAGQLGRNEPPAAGRAAPRCRR